MTGIDPISAVQHRQADSQERSSAISPNDRLWYTVSFVAHARQPDRQCESPPLQRPRRSSKLCRVLASFLCPLAIGAGFLLAGVAVAETPAVDSNGHQAFQYLMKELENFSSGGFKDLSAEVCSKYTSHDLDQVITLSSNASYKFYEEPHPGANVGDRVWRLYDGELTSYRALTVTINDRLMTCAAWVRATPIAF